MDLVETRLPNGMFSIASRDVQHPRSLDIADKNTLAQKDKLLLQKSIARQEFCWLRERNGCKRKATVWVRECGYDFKGGKAAPVDHVAISSQDYDGPVPGFCHFCIGLGPQELAQTVYFNRPEMYWGARPNRWFISFTDGTRQGGMCIEIDPKQELPKIVEQHIRKESHG